MKLMSPAGIYGAVRNEIDRILGVLQVPASDQDVADVQSTLKDVGALMDVSVKALLGSLAFWFISVVLGFMELGGSE